MLDKCPGSTFRIVPRKYRNGDSIKIYLETWIFSLSLSLRLRKEDFSEERRRRRVASLPRSNLSIVYLCLFLDRGNSWVERRKERPAFYYRSLEPRENIFTSGRERKERRADRGAVAGWHEMTDPSSLSVYTPSIFVGANRAAV